MGEYMRAVNGWGIEEVEDLEDMTKHAGTPILMVGLPHGVRDAATLRCPMHGQTGTCKLSRGVVEQLRRAREPLVDRTVRLRQLVGSVRPRTICRKRFPLYATNPRELMDLR